MKYDLKNKKLIDEPELKDIVINAFIHQNLKGLKAGCKRDDNRKIYEF